MAAEQPSLEQVEHDVRAMLVETELATLATIADDGYPSASTMHIVGDGLRAYMHVFTHTVNKFQQMRDNPKVSYALRFVAPGGFYEREKTRQLTIRGNAVWVTSPEEVAHAARLSMEQFEWAQQAGMYKNIKSPLDAEAPAQQSFFRIDPIDGQWTDHKYGLKYRVRLEFSPDGTSLVAVHPAGQAARRAALAETRNKG